MLPTKHSSSNSLHRNSFTSQQQNYQRTVHAKTVKRKHHKRIEMQSPGLKEASQVCFHACCPSPSLGFADTSKKISKPRSTVSASRRDFATNTTSSIFPDSQFTNPESIPSLEESLVEFSKAFPQFSETYQVDDIRAREYYHLSVSKHTCLDYIGIGLFSHSQIQEVDHENIVPLSSSSGPFPLPLPRPLGATFSTPQISNIPFFSVSYKTGNLKMQLLHGGEETTLESAMRRRIMNFLKVPESDYHMVFTANRTSAFKLLADSYPFQSSRKLLTVYDHESEAVETMNRSSKKKGAKVMSAEFLWPRLRINSAKLRKMIDRKAKKKKKRGLFVYPLHSRMTGARYPYLWMSIARENGWHILVDACALGPKDMDSFALSLIRPDFLICSFYKIFGENPSGFGCLFVKKSTVPILEDSDGTGMVSIVPANKLLQSLDESSGTDTEIEQKWKAVMEQNDVPSSDSFSGPASHQTIQSGTVELGETSASQKEGNAAAQKTSETSEVDEPRKALDTIQPESIKATTPEIECRGLDQVDLLGLTQISNRARCLINWLTNALLKLKHPHTDQIPLIRIYGPKIKFDRGPALAFNIFDWRGEKVEAPLVQKLADRNNISLSYGFLHNISFSEKYEQERLRVLDGYVGNGRATSKRKEKLKPGITVVTAALGFLANFEDAYRLWAFIAQFTDADFVEKAKWRYTALNQKTIEI